MRSDSERRRRPPVARSNIPQRSPASHTPIHQEVTHVDEAAQQPAAAGRPLDEATWRRILTQVKIQHPTLNRVWFAQLRPMAIAGGVIAVHCADIAQLNYLTGKCTEPFSHAAQNVTHRLLSVVFRCETTPKGGVFDQADEPMPLSPDYTFENFIEGHSNRFAHAAATAVGDAPGTNYNPLFIHGLPGLGKTHLLQAICQAVLAKRPSARIRYISCEDFITQYIDAVEAGQMTGFRHRFRHADVLIIDDIHFLAGKEQTQEEFFHTFNTLWQNKKQIVLSADVAPGEIPDMEERLTSRFNWGIVARIERPHLETRIAIVKKKARMRDIQLDDAVVEYIATRFENNTRELEGAIMTVDGYARSVQEPATVDLARHALGEPPAENHTVVTIEAINEAVSRYFNVKVHELQGKRRTKSIAWPRQICMFLARRHTRYSYAEIGGFYGGRDHTTVMHGIKKVTAALGKEDDTTRQLDQIESRFAPSS
ncbi:MAG: chromosomal replication initiator protein DnaA [Planctomycetota bacterium]